jgi:hypothetical protein
MAEGLNSATKKMNSTHNLVVERFLDEGKNVLFIPESGSEFTDSFISYLWKNFISSSTMIGSYFHLNMPLSIEERLKEMTYDEAEALFLTDDKLHSENDYNGWEISFDNHTGAVYFHDPNSLLELYCSPSFEGDWGKMVFCLSSQYEFEDGDNTRVIDEINAINSAGDIEGQLTKWRATAHAIIDDIKHHVKQYDDMVLRARVDSAVYGLYDGREILEAMKSNRDTYARIQFLTESLYNEFKKIKS